MQVIKRDGSYELISFDKITKRINDLVDCGNLLKNVDPLLVAKETINGIYNGIKTTELDILSADICATKSQHHPEYNKLGGRILASNIAKITSEDYLSVVTELYSAGIISDDFFKFVTLHHHEIQSMLDYQRDFLFDYFAIKTLERSYLFKIDGIIKERPQHMWMRVAIQVSPIRNDGDNPLQLQYIKETYELLSTLYFTHATPTLFNAGTKHPQLSSCFLTSSEDNIEDIFKSISDVAKISKWAGGIGLSLSNIRAKGSMIRGTNGKSEGIIPLCKTLETVGRYINQGGKRNGSIAVYLEPYHADIESFIELRKNTGDENLRARDLFIALWIPDLFMKRVQADAEWTLMCPNECPGLVDSFGETFETLYINYEKEKKGKKTIRARDLWNKILENQIETGMPYLSFKDTVNRRNMQQHLGVIRNSNLCVVGETQILTSEGYVTIQSKVNQVVNVWNGETWSETTVLQTGEKQEVLTVVCSNGSELVCTPYHKFYIVESPKKIVQINASDLKEGQVLIPCNFPIIDGPISNLIMNDDSDNNLKSRVNYLKTIFNYKGIGDYQISSTSKKLLENIKLLCNTMGCQPSLTCSTKYTYILSFCMKDVVTLSKLGCINDKDNDTENNNEEIPPVTIKGIIFSDRLSDTYCFKEEKRGMGVFNGILTGQCNEIALYSDKDNIAVCNLSSICLPRFVENGTFNFEKLRKVAGVCTRNLNQVIDVNFYPTPETSKTNMQHRPIGIGVQGLADVYCMLGYPFGSDEARELNRLIFEHIYYGAVEMSIQLAKQYGPFPSFNGSLHEQCKLQFDLYTNETFQPIVTLDWNKLKQEMDKYGIRNSMLTALMPTASTSQIMCNNECFEPYTSNIYLRKTLAGEFTVVNQHLISDLLKLGLWNQKIYEEILFDNGSVQKIKSIPDSIKNIYKTAYEIKITDMLKQAVERSPFVDHMQSMNLFMAKPDFNLLNSSHFYSWKHGLKTGMYYLRTQAAVDAIKFGIDPSSIQRIKDERKQTLKDAGVVDGACPRDPYLRSICDNCSS